MADVARLAGVSTGTVSRVLSRPEMISAPTRARVQAAAQRLGYVANGAARALAMRRTQTVGALVPRFGTSSFPTLVQALESTLADNGYNLLLAAPDHARAQDPSIIRALLGRGVDAVAILGAEQPPEVLALLHAHRTPFIFLWAQESEYGPCVGFDEREAASLVVNHLADQGHARLGFIGGRTLDNERARRRFVGVFEAVAKRGLTLVSDGLIETEYGFREGFEAMQVLLQKRVEVSAVVCGNDYLAAGALSALQVAGVQVPEGMAVASFNDNDFAAFTYPPLTTVRVPIREMGEQAALHLVARLAGRTPIPPPLLPVELVVRGSTTAVPRASQPVSVIQDLRQEQLRTI